MHSICVQSPATSNYVYVSLSLSRPISLGRRGEGGRPFFSLLFLDFFFFFYKKERFSPSLREYPFSEIATLCLIHAVVFVELKILCPEFLFCRGMGCCVYVCVYMGGGFWARGGSKDFVKLLRGRGGGREGGRVSIFCPPFPLLLHFSFSFSRVRGPGSQGPGVRGLAK